MRWNYREHDTFLLHDNHGETPVGDSWFSRYNSGGVEPPPPDPDPELDTIKRHAEWISNKAQRRTGRILREGESVEIQRRCERIIELDAEGS